MGLKGDIQISKYLAPKCSTYANGGRGSGSSPLPQRQGGISRVDISIIEPHYGISRFLRTRGTQDCFMPVAGLGRVGPLTPLAKVPDSSLAAQHRKVHC